MIPKTPSNKRELSTLVAKGEGLTLEFKRSTGELKEGMQTACAFLNGSGGLIIFGVSPDGKLMGQHVSDATLREIAQSFDRFEPPVSLPIERLRLANGTEVLILRVEKQPDSAPFAFEGRAYERITSTTRRMPQEKYEKSLFNRAHGKQRWENTPAEGVTARDLDRAEITRVVEAAREAGRLVGPVGGKTSSILDRLRVSVDGQILNAAVVLFGKEFMPDYPQCELRMARFKGIDKTEFLDQKHVRASAFKMLEEALLFCQRHLPLPGRIESGRLERRDRPLIPPEALREIMVNALIHRDYSMYGAAISLAIFDDRVEVWSGGRFPAGITPDILTREHPSVQRNPLIAEVFNRAGLIECWGRGTNRVITMCKTAGIPSPEFSECGSFAVVTFRVDVAGLSRPTTQVTTQVTMQVTMQVRAMLAAARQPVSRSELQRAAGLENREHFRKAYLKRLMDAGWLEPTIPNKPNSRLQRYRITADGEAALKHQTAK